ncbi:MAG TPA: PEP-CTERM sorting domain-containing protein [Pirellulales bacterium]|jgi:hypothetical protein
MASLLGLQQTFPDTTAFTTVSYDAFTHIFSASAPGNSATVNLLSSSTVDYDILDDNLGSAYNLSVKLTAAGAIDNTGSNTFTLYGDAYDDATLSTPMPGSNPNQPWLTGTVTGFGFSTSSGPPFQFQAVVSNITGDAASLFGSQVGIILFDTGNWPNPFTGSFAANFNSGNLHVTSDLFPVPEPSTGILFLIGLGSAGFFCRRRGSRLSNRSALGGSVRTRC